jgi:hypothetical protein
MIDNRNTFLIVAKVNAFGTANCLVRTIGRFGTNLLPGAFGELSFGGFGCDNPNLAHRRKAPAAAPHRHR